MRTCFELLTQIDWTGLIEVQFIYVTEDAIFS
jgi:hypothetical protein